MPGHATHHIADTRPSTHTGAAGGVQHHPLFLSAAAAPAAAAASFEATLTGLQQRASAARLRLRELPVQQKTLILLVAGGIAGACGCQDACGSPDV